MYGYHVTLALTDNQVKQLKQLALTLDKPVTRLVTDLVVQAIGATDAYTQGVREGTIRKIKK